MVVEDVLVVVEDVVSLGGSDVSGTEEAVDVVVLLVVVAVSATGAGGKPCASTTLPDGTDVVVSVGAEAIVAVIAAGTGVDVPDSLSLPEEQDAASKAADSAIAM